MNTILIAQRKQRLIWGAATFLVVLLGFAQRDQRALLPGADPLPVSAFVAITPQAPGALNGFAASNRGSAGRNAQRPFDRSEAVANLPYASAANANSPTSGTAPSAFVPEGSTAPSALLALADPGSRAALNPGPGVGGDLAFLSPGGAQPTGVSSNTPGAVPEAPIWAIMIIGIGGIGCAARRERARGRNLLRPRLA